MAKGKKTGGRRPGSLNKATLAAREFHKMVVDDPTYRAKLLAKARAGKLHPTVECMIWHYAVGKPVDTVKLEGALTMRGVQSDADLDAAIAGLMARADGTRPDPR